MKLVIPVKFKKVIESDLSLSGAMDTLVDQFSDVLTNNKTEFFPEYTDHGIDHVQSVINTASEIISEKSWKYITPEDVYVLISSILLHDCAMHLNRDGLWDLISNDLYNGVLLGFDNEEEWSSRWSKFCVEVKKYDDHDYDIFFGEYRDVNMPNVGDKSLSDNQKIIIGDFVRRYHACIAQVISTYGIPTKDGALKIFDSNKSYLNQLSGFVARSHNHKLRDVVDILGDERKREHRNTHPTFLMGVLRIADYLQLKEERTPKILFNSIGFCSPISIMEWKKHLSIISTNDYHPDDELLFIEAFPEDAGTLVGIKQLLSGLQGELDEYWAVSGEVYSRYFPLSDLVINYRRVKSNIDNAAKYVDDNHKNYFPEVLSVKADNKKLFPLLIKPLYGDLPQVGFREILQNSLDASNERYSQDVDGDVDELDIPYSINVEINFDNNTFTIIDNGMGMTVDIIRNYFLKVGASYRTSEQWKSKYLVDNSGSVPRTGKFGIGMLAGFLIGDEVEVKTKHARDEAGRSIYFKYKIDSSEIELRFDRKTEVGTILTIHSDEKRLRVIEKSLKRIYGEGRYYAAEDEISSWWYFLDSPKVNVVVVDDGVKEIDLTYKIKKSELKGTWSEVVDSSLDKYYWRIHNEYNNVYCNGIMIQNRISPQVIIDFGLDVLNFGHLEICLFDNAGNFPLNLTRDDLVINTFFEIDKLEVSVKSKYVNDFKRTLDNYTYTKEAILKIVFGNRFNVYNEFVPVIFSKNEVFPFFSDEHLKCDELVYMDFIYPNQNRGLIYHPEFSKLNERFSYSLFNDVEKKQDSIESAINKLLLNRRHSSSWQFDGADKELTGQNFSAWLYVRKFDFDKLQDTSEGFLNRRGISLIKSYKDWVVLSKNEDIDDIPDIGEEVMNLEDNKIFMFSFLRINEITKTEFSTLWSNS